MKIEKLNKRDMEQYKFLIDECFGESNELRHYERKYYDESLSYEIIVAKDNDKIIGSISFVKINLFTFSFHPSIEVFNVAVLPDYRGQKVAKSMFNYIIEYARNNGFKSISLTCYEEAYDAIKLYESVGFNKVQSVKYNLDL